MRKNTRSASADPCHLHVKLVPQREGYMNKSKDKTPVFTTEHEERQFWEQNDSSEFFDWNKADLVSFPNLKPSTKTMSTPLH